jgi:hypothetical protein
MVPGGENTLMIRRLIVPLGASVASRSRSARWRSGARQRVWTGQSLVIWMNASQPAAPGMRVSMVTNTECGI